MKKGLRNFEGLCIHDGGDEGNRTPDLLTASQALSQLSYAPVRRSTIRELGRRCKDIFGKTFRGRGRRSPAGGRRCRRPPIRLHSGRPRDPRHETGPSTTFGRHPPTMASRARIKPQVDGLRFSRNTGYGRGVGVKRSRWAGFVAAASQTADRGRPEMSKQAICK